jgi:hypothetical protein
VRTPLRRRRIYLLRHAEVAYFDQAGRPLPPDEVPLTARGRQQAATAGAALAGARIDRVVTSGLPRTVGTARLLADPGWDTVLAVLHGGVNRAILSFALTGRRELLGGFEQAPACINVLDVDDAGALVVRAVNVTPWDPTLLAGRATTMEELWAQYGRAPGSRALTPPARLHQGFAQPAATPGRPARKGGRHGRQRLQGDRAGRDQHGVLGASCRRRR